MMKIDFDSQIKDIDGSPLTENEKPVILRRLCTTALLATYANEPTITEEEKLSRFALALKIHQPEKPELSVENMALLKRLVGMAYPPLIVGRVFEIIEGSPKEVP